MKLPVYFAQALAGEVSVDLGSGDVYMSQHGLYGSQVCSSVKEMGRKCMTQGMGVYFAARRTLPCVPVEQLPESLTGERLGRTGEKEVGAGTAFGEERPGGV